VTAFGIENRRAQGFRVPPPRGPVGLVDRLANVAESLIVSMIVLTGIAAATAAIGACGIAAAAILRQAGLR